MDLSSLESLVPDTRMRYVGSAQYDHHDLATIVPHPENRSRLGSSIVNAFAALVQVKPEPAVNFVVLSSDLALASTGRISRKSTVTEQIAEFVQSACMHASIDDPFRRRYWLLPLCDDGLGIFGRDNSPTHWILAVVDLTDKKIIVFDSISVLRSSTWAGPLAQDIVSEIHRAYGHSDDAYQVHAWLVESHGPRPNEEQRDAWACGLFVMMAIESFATSGTLDAAHSEKEGFRTRVYNLLIEQPVYARPAKLKAQIPPPQPVVQVHTAGVSSVPSAASLQSSLPAVQATGPDALGCFGDAKPPSIPESGIRPSKKLKTSHPQLGKSVTKQPSRPESNTCGPSRPTTAKKTRSTRMSPEDKAALLTANETVLSHTPHSLKCAGCLYPIKLHKTTPCDLAPWKKHQQKCIGLELRDNEYVLRDVQAALHGSSTSVQDVEAPAAPTPSSSIHAASRSQGLPVHLFFQNPVPPLPTPLPLREERACAGLCQADHAIYAANTVTRDVGGVSPKRRAQLKRKLFPYKYEGASDTRDEDESCSDSGSDGGSTDSDDVDGPADLPDDGNRCSAQPKWTNTEASKYLRSLKARAVWRVDHVHENVRSPQCTGVTADVSGVCQPCRNVGKLRSFRDQVQRKVKESNLSPTALEEIRHMRRKFTPKSLISGEMKELLTQLEHPVFAGVFDALAKKDVGSCFLQLHLAASQGKLGDDRQVVKDLCSLLADKIRRESSDNPDLKYGVRYTPVYLNFCLLLRSYGSASNQHYGLFRAQFPAVSSRHLRTLVNKADDALLNPDNLYENLAKVHRASSVHGYRGPILVGGDCTKVKKRLSFDPYQGGHVLGSTLSLSESAASVPAEAEAVVERAQREGAVATQVRAILAHVPLPGYRPIVIALLPTTGKDDGPGIYKTLKEIREICARLGLPILGAAADGAASEVLAQELCDAEDSDLNPITYRNATYGINIKANVFSTGPFIPLPDPCHTRKTARNQPQHGTHNGSAGIGYIINYNAVELCKIKASGLYRSDVINVDKQDDGAAQRFFHEQALKAMTVNNDGELSIPEDFLGLFFYCFVLGSLVDAYLSRHITHEERLLAAFRARMFLAIWYSHIRHLSQTFPDLYSTTRSFISPQSFKTLNRMCDTLIALLIVYAEVYPDIPFCPWIFGTAFVEHFFGIARTLLPDFTYAQLLHLVKHVQVQQQLLLSGNFPVKKDYRAREGYLYDHDTSRLSPESLNILRVRLTRAQLDAACSQGFAEARAIALKLRMFIPLVDEVHPLELVPLCGPSKLPSAAKRVQPVISNAPDSDDESDVGEEDEETESDAEGSDDGPSTATPTEVLAQASAHAARDAALQALDESDDTQPEAANTIPLLASHAPFTPNLSSSSTTASPSSSSISPTKPAARVIIDSILIDGQLSLSRILEMRASQQSTTRVHSEQVAGLNPKFAELVKDTGVPATKAALFRENAHRVRVAQSDTQKEQTRRETRWTAGNQRVVLIVKGNASHVHLAVTAPAKIDVDDELHSQDIIPAFEKRNISDFVKLARGSFVVVLAKYKDMGRFYLGEVLEVYSQSTTKRHSSVDCVTSAKSFSALALRAYLLTPGSDENRGLFNVKAAQAQQTVYETRSPVFSCEYGHVQTHLYTWAPAHQIVYHLGHKAFTSNDPSSRSARELTASHARTWALLTRPDLRAELFNTHSKRRSRAVS